MAKYEYKWVMGPVEFTVKSKKDADTAVKSYADFINKEAVGGWEFYSIHPMTLKERPGCFSFGKPQDYLLHMLIFKREKP